MKAQSLSLPSVISSNMVLQQDTEVTLWGWATPHRKVRIKPDWQTNYVETRANQNGKWTATIKTLAFDNQAHKITITAGKSINLENILFGEVWLCSGQSNMEMPLAGWAALGQPVYGSEIAIKTADFEPIRLFQTKQEVHVAPRADCQGEWKICSPTTVADFSAVAFFFGRELYQKLKVPIGLIHSSRGGSSIEAWMSKNNLLNFKEFQKKFKHFQSIDKHLNGQQNEYERELSLWYRRFAVPEKIISESSINHWQSKTFDDSGWQTMYQPTKWSQTSIKNYEGFIWFRRKIIIPQKWAFKPIVFSLGTIDAMDVCWVNGIKIGESIGGEAWKKPRFYTIKGLAAGEHQLVVRILNLASEGGFTDKAEKLYYYPKGRPQDAMPLAGSWKFKQDIDLEALPPSPQAPNKHKHRVPSVLYNAMISPLIPYTIKGVIWYQGETNIAHPELYTRLFPSLIAQWRKDWKQPLMPFYFVQIAPFRYGNNMNSAALREAQSYALYQPQTAMVVTMDLGSLTNIHPANKYEVGRRLSLLTLNKLYGFDKIACESPSYRSMRIENNKIRLFFNNTYGAMMTKGGTVGEFIIKNQDGNFVEAKAYIEKNTVIVYHPSVKNPTAVRYAWTNTSQASLFNKAGLPLSPFRTDTEF